MSVRDLMNNYTRKFGVRSFQKKHTGWYILAFILLLSFIGYFNTFITPGSKYINIILDLVDFIFIFLGMIFNGLLSLFTDFQFFPSFGGGKNRIIAGRLADAAIITLQVSIISIAIGFIIGIILALLLISSGRTFGLKALAQAYVDFFRSTPLIVQILLIFFGIPQFIQEFGTIMITIPFVDITILNLNLERFNFTPWVGGVIALSLNTAAYQAEIIRAGILSIPTGQTEASRGLGLSSMQSMQYVILPQALRLILPPFTNESVNVILNSSLLLVISLGELTRKSRDLSGFYWTPFEIYATAAIFYFVMAFSLAKLTKRLEQKYRIPGLGVTQE